MTPSVSAGWLEDHWERGGEGSGMEEGRAAAGSVAIQVRG